jgi:hypothetical protein
MRGGSSESEASAVEERVDAEVEGGEDMGKGVNEGVAEEGAVVAVFSGGSM